jgi:hypothetical protein
MKEEYTVAIRYAGTKQYLYACCVKYNEKHISFSFTGSFGFAHRFRSRRMRRYVMNKIATRGHKPICNRAY